MPPRRDVARHKLNRRSIMLHHMRGLGIAGGRCTAAWVGAVALGFALFGLVGGAAQANTITEFSAGITGGAGSTYITAGPDGNLWFTEQNGNRIGRITTGRITTGRFPLEAILMLLLE
jgi:streptogramin lyase